MEVARAKAIFHACRFGSQKQKPVSVDQREQTNKKENVNSQYSTQPHPRRQNVTTSMVGLKNGHICKNLTKNGEPLRYS